MTEDRPVAWVTGAGGLIGSYFVRTAERHGSAWRVRGLTRRELELTDFAAVRRAFAQDRPGLVIHCAALSRNPQCTAHPAQARLENVEVTEHLAALASQAQFVLFSTDLVFDGNQGWYAEEARVNPLSVYAETKVAAEQVAIRHPRHFIIRTSLNGGASPTGDRGFNEQMRLDWHQGRTTRLFTDEYRAPLFAGLTAQATWELVTRAPSGIYHVAGSERLSRWQIGERMAARWPQLAPRLEAASLRDYAGPPRPPDTTLNCAKAQQHLTFSLPGFTTWLTQNPAEDF
jgi:dTDP-4-dehydrorhamnose reductase